MISKSSTWGGVGQKLLGLFSLLKKDFFKSPGRKHCERTRDATKPGKGFFMLAADFQYLVCNILNPPRLGISLSPKLTFSVQLLPRLLALKSSDLV